MSGIVWLVLARHDTPHKLLRTTFWVVVEACVQSIISCMSIMQVWLAYDPITPCFIFAFTKSEPGIHLVFVHVLDPGCAGSDMYTWKQGMSGLRPYGSLISIKIFTRKSSCRVETWIGSGFRSWQYHRKQTPARYLGRRSLKLLYMTVLEILSVPEALNRCAKISMTPWVPHAHASTCRPWDWVDHIDKVVDGDFHDASIRSRISICTSSCNGSWYRFPDS